MQSLTSRVRATKTFISANLESADGLAQAERLEEAHGLAEIQKGSVEVPNGFGYLENTVETAHSADFFGLCCRKSHTMHGRSPGSQSIFTWFGRDSLR